MPTKNTLSMTERTWVFLIIWRSHVNCQFITGHNLIHAHWSTYKASLDKITLYAIIINLQYKFWRKSTLIIKSLTVANTLSSFVFYCTEANMRRQINFISYPPFFYLSCPCLPSTAYFSTPLHNHIENIGHTHHRPEFQTSMVGELKLHSAGTEAAD